MKLVLLRAALLLLLTSCAHRRVSRPWAELPPKRQAARIYRSAQASIAEAARARQPVVTRPAVVPERDPKLPDMVAFPPIPMDKDVLWTYWLVGWDGDTYWVGLEIFDDRPVALTAIVAIAGAESGQRILVPGKEWEEKQPAPGVRCWYRDGAGVRRPLGDPDPAALLCP